MTKWHKNAGSGLDRTVDSIEASTRRLACTVVLFAPPKVVFLTSGASFPRSQGQQENNSYNIVREHKYFLLF